MKTDTIFYRLFQTFPDLNGDDFSSLTLTRQIVQIGPLIQQSQLPVTLIGSSFGGLTAAWLAETYFQVQRLVLLAPAFNFGPIWLGQLGAETLANWQKSGSLSVYHYGYRRYLPIYYKFIEDLANYPQEKLIRQLPTLIVFVALAAIVNGLLGLLPDIAGAPLTLERILGVLFAPLVWLIGVPAHDAQLAGALLGVKLVLTEFTAFIQLGATPVDAIDPRTRVLMAYALCGFANIASVGMNVAGYSILVPERRSEVIGMVWKAMFAGFLATCLSASIVGLLPRELFH